MPSFLVRLDEVEQLIAVQGADAIGTLVGRIADAVRRCDDQAVGELDSMLQLAEARLERPWRMLARRGSVPRDPALKMLPGERPQR